MTKSLLNHPTLEVNRKQAKALVRDFAAGIPESHRLCPGVASRTCETHHGTRRTVRDRTGVRLSRMDSVEVGYYGQIC